MTLPVVSNPLFAGSYNIKVADIFVSARHKHALIFFEYR